MAAKGPKPSITIVYDAHEEIARTEAKEAGKKVPSDVSEQIENVLTKRGYAISRASTCA